MVILFACSLGMGLLSLCVGVVLLLFRKYERAIACVMAGIVIAMTGVCGVLSFGIESELQYSALPDSKQSRDEFCRAFYIASDWAPSDGETPTSTTAIPSTFSDIRYGTYGFQDFTVFIRFKFSDASAIEPLVAGWTPLANSSELDIAYGPEWWVQERGDDAEFYGKDLDSSFSPSSLLLIVDRNEGIAYYRAE